MLMSVVITTFNREDVLRQNLDCFMKQTDKNFEVVVAIDGSTDGTGELVKNAELVRLEGEGVGAAIDSGHRKLLEIIEGAALIARFIFASLLSS